MPRAPEVPAGSAALLLVAAAACGTARPPAPAGGPGVSGPSTAANPELTVTATVRHEGMSCLRATRVARASLLRMGYVIDEVRRAGPAAAGRVSAHRDTGWAPASPEAGRRRFAAVDAACDDAGASLTLLTDAGIFGRSRLARRFETAVAQVVRRPRRATPPRASAGRGIVVHAERLPPEGAAAGAGPDATAPRLAVFRLRIDNHTHRPYRLPADAVRLLTTGGRRVVVQLDRWPPVRGELSGSALRPGPLPAGGALEGLVFAPAAAYRRISVIVIDTASGESEGFRIEL